MFVLVINAVISELNGSENAGTEFLPPAYVVRREGNSFTLFVSPHLGGGYPYPIMLCNISQNAMGQPPGGGGGYPARSSWGGYPGRGGYPGGGVPRSGGGYPGQVQTELVPQLGPTRGVPQPGLTGGVPQPGPMGEGTPARSGWGVSEVGYPLAGMGYLRWGTPGRDGVPPVRSGWGCLQWGTPWQGWGTPHPGEDRGYPRWSTPWEGWGTPPSTGQEMEYLIRHGRYASCIQAGGLSCYHNI